MKTFQSVITRLYSGSQRASLKTNMQTEASPLTTTPTAIESTIQPNNQEQAHVAAMSGQEVWFLLDKGYQPLGLVMGVCLYAVGTITNLVNTAKGNLYGEVKDYSTAMYQARALAFSRMQFEADQLGADGIIINVLDLKYLRSNQLIEAAVKGTAVRYVGTASKKLPSQHGKVVIAVKGSDRKEEPLVQFK